MLRREFLESNIFKLLHFSITKLIAGETFSDTDLQEMTKYMQEALRVAAIAKRKGMVGMATSS